MNEAKPFASLSPTLLARKGQAKPAMRRQSFNITSEPSANGQIQNFHPEQDDLGWNDMGHEDTLYIPITPQNPTISLDPPAPSPAVEQQKMLQREFAVPKAPVARAAPGSNGKAAFTLRLDAERHLRLRLVCAVNHRSAQQIVTQALDEFLAQQPEIGLPMGNVRDNESSGDER